MPGDVVKPSSGIEARAIPLMAVADTAAKEGQSRLESELRETALNIVAVVCFLC